MHDLEKDNEHAGEVYHRKNLNQNGSYRFPEGQIFHVGAYGINEKDPALAQFEGSSARVHRKQQREILAQRKKRRIQLVVVFMAIIVLISAGGFCVFALGNNDAQDEEIVPVAAPIEVPEDTEGVSEEYAAAEDTTTESTTESTTTSATAVEDSSYTRVINRTYPIPADYIAGTGELMDIEGKQMETNACLALKDMVASLRAAGMDIVIQSAYRSDADQEYLYNRQISRQGGNEIKAATISAVPLTSEHQAGLAVDLSVDGTLTDAFGATAQGQWLKEHCAEYGFILRYPPEKTSITGIISEPWHFRYVGSAETAQAIMSSGQCMEEYYGKYLAAEDLDSYLPYLGLD